MNNRYNSGRKRHTVTLVNHARAEAKRHGQATGLTSTTLPPRSVDRGREAV